MQIRVGGLKESNGKGYLLPGGGDPVWYDPSTMMTWIGPDAPAGYKRLRVVANFDSREFEFWDDA